MLGILIGNPNYLSTHFPLTTTGNIVNNNDFLNFSGLFDTNLGEDSELNKVMKSGFVGGAVGDNLVK